MSADPYYRDYQTATRLTLENVLVFLVDVLENLRRQAEVFCYHRFGGMLDPFIQQKRAVLREVTAVEDQQKLGSILTQPLEGMRVA